MATSNQVRVAWFDETVPSLLVTGRSDIEVELQVEVVTQCAGEVVTWSADAGVVPAAGSVELAVPGLGDAGRLAWSDWGVRLAVKLQVSDPETGRVLQFVQAPDRVIFFDEAGWSLRGAEELETLEARGPAAEPAIVVAIEPGQSVIETVDIDTLEVE